MFRLLVLCCLLAGVLADDLLPKMSLSGISLGEADAAKKLKLSGQKHLLSAGGHADIEQKMGNAEKVSDYDKDRGFFFMKAYGWDREKKKEHLNAEGKHLKASKAGKILKAGGDFSKSYKENQGSNQQIGGNYGLGSGLYENGGFAKRMGYSKPSTYEPHGAFEEFKYMKPEVEYSDGPSSYEVIEPKSSYYPNKPYNRIHYPVSGTYVPEMNYKNTYDSYKKPLSLWNQGYHAAKYYNKPTDDHHVEDNMVEYYGSGKTKYPPLHIPPHDSHYPSMGDQYSGYKYSDDKYEDEDEGRHYYDKKMTDIDIDKLRESYSKYNDDYAGTQLLPQKIHLETSPVLEASPVIESSPILEQPVVKKKYRLWEGSHYY